MSSVHEDMEREGEFWRPEWADSFAQRVGVGAAAPGEEGVAEVLEILGDGEAHTIETISSFLEFMGNDLSGCQIASCLARLSEDGHRIQMLGPYDTFGSPARFKLLTKEAA